MALGTPTAVVTTAGIVALGLWASDKKIDVKFVVGTGLYAVALSVFGEINAQLASQFAVLVLVTAALIYFRRIAIALGLTGKANSRSAWG